MERNIPIVYVEKVLQFFYFNSQKNGSEVLRLYFRSVYLQVELSFSSVYIACFGLEVQLLLFIILVPNWGWMCTLSTFTVQFTNADKLAFALH